MTPRPALAPSDAAGGGAGTDPPTGGVGGAVGVVGIVGPSCLPPRLRAAQPPARASASGRRCRRPPHSSICAPSSTTRLGGKWKNWVAGRALRDRNEKRTLRQRAIGA